MTTASACPRCGQRISAGRYCSACGMEVTVVPGPANTQPVGAATFEESMLELVRQATLGEFEILKELGRGGMAVVYLAHEIALNRKVALKVMSPTLGADESMAERFVREAQTAASLSHPNIIPVYAVRHTPSITFFVMKFVAGRPLDDIMDELGAMPIPMVTAILTQVAGALGYGHKHGVVHRDVKPGNIMIDDEGWAIVTDFGIAKVESVTGLTQTGAAIGTPTYMSPEQCTAQSVTGASDQYSLGVVAYEMLTGKKLFDGDSAMSIMYGHVHEPPPDLLQRRPDCPRQLYETVMRMLDKQADDRFANMEETISAVGATPLKHDDPIRTQMMTLAASGLSAKLLQQVRTPRSPIPLSGMVGPPNTAGVTAGPTVVASSAPGTVQTTTSSPVKSKRALLGVLGLVAVAAGATAIVQPWKERPPVTQGGGGPLDGAPLVASVFIESPVIGQDFVVGDAVTLVGNVTDSLGNTVAGGDIAWSSSDPTVATVGFDGTVEAVGVGSVTITALAQGVQSEIALKVARPSDTPPTPAVVTSVQLNRGSVTIQSGDGVTLRATATDANGVRVRGRTVRWRSNDESVVTVSAQGRVIGVDVGTATISATVEGQRADARITVESMPASDVETVANVAVNPATTTLKLGDAAQLRASASNPSGSAVTGKTFTWTTSDPNVVTVNSNGLVQGVGAGRATVTASVDGRSNMATIVVEAGTPPPISGPTEAESRAQIESLIQAYAQAIESRDLSRVRQLNPGMSDASAGNLGDVFENARELSVTHSISDITISGHQGTARYTSVVRIRDRRGRSITSPPRNVEATLVLQSAQWSIVTVRDVSRGGV